MYLKLAGILIQSLTRLNFEGEKGWGCGWEEDMG